MLKMNKNIDKSVLKRFFLQLYLTYVNKNRERALFK